MGLMAKGLTVNGYRYSLASMLCFSCTHLHTICIIVIA